MLVLPQVLLWPVAWYWVLLHEMYAAGCGPCDYALAYAADVGLWIAAPVIAVLTFVALVVCGKRGWRRWPVALVGIGLLVLAVYVVTHVILRALGVD